MLVIQHLKTSLKGLHITADNLQVNQPYKNGKNNTD